MEAIMVYFFNIDFPFFSPFSSIYVEAITIF